MRPTKLPKRVRQRIEDADEVFVSAVCAWEASIKSSLGKLRLPEPISSVVVEEGFVPLPITLEHGEAVALLPWLHKDPFDRLLVAQAQTEHLILLSDDPFVAAYDVLHEWD